MLSPADRESVRDRVLHRATHYVESVGLSFGMSAEFIEQVSADAGVSSRHFSQVWRSPEAFFADLFIELANEARIDRADTQTLLTTWQYLSMRTDDLHTPEGRRRVLIDVVRSAAEYNFDVVTASNKWRTYTALSTTIMSWPNVETRTQVLDALRASELAFVDTMESFYRNVLPTVGYRLKPLYGNDYQSFVIASASVIEGLGIVRSTVPALVEAHFTMPVDNGEEAWSVAALAFMGVVEAFIEPDPDFSAETAISRLNGGVDVTPADEATVNSVL